MIGTTIESKRFKFFLLQELLACRRPYKFYARYIRIVSFPYKNNNIFGDFMNFSGIIFRKKLTFNSLIRELNLCISNFN